PWVTSTWTGSRISPWSPRAGSRFFSPIAEEPKLLLAVRALRGGALQALERLGGEGGALLWAEAGEGGAEPGQLPPGARVREGRGQEPQGARRTFAIQAARRLEPRERPQEILGGGLLLRGRLEGA